MTRCGSPASGWAPCRTCRLQADRKVLVKFDAGRDIELTDGTKAQIKYLNLVGDRYLELVDAPGSTKILPAGAQIPDRPHGARAGPRPAARRPEARYPGAQSAGRQRALGVAAADTAGPGRHHRIAVLQDVVVLECARGQQPGDRATDRRSQDDAEDAVRGRRPVLRARSTNSNNWCSGLSEDRDPIGEAITALDNGTASLSDLLGQARPPLDGTIDQVKRPRRHIWMRTRPTFDATLQTAARDLPQAGAGGLLRRVLPVLHLRNRFPRQRSRGPHRSVPLDQARDGKVPGRMNKYRGASLVRAGFIGVVLIILVIAIGLQPERLMSWATALRYQALFTEAGGLDRRQRRDGVRNQGRLGLVDRTRQRRCAGRIHDRRQVRARLGHHGAHPHRHPARRAGAGAGVRGQRHVAAERRSSRSPGRRRRIR